MAHDHEHSRPSDGEHGHAHGPPRTAGRAFAIGIGLNLAFVFAEVVFGLLAHSVALVADAAHNLSDVLGLALAWGATVLARRKPSRKHTYGLRRTTILAALANALFLVAVVGVVGWEAAHRIARPDAVEGKTVIAVAAVGVLVNGGSALLFLRGSEGDVNLRGAFLHLASDAVAALGVIIAGVIIVLTGWLRADPVVSLLVSAATLVGTWSLLRKSLDLALDAVPAHIDADAVRTFLASLSCVEEVHDLHIWAMSTTEVAATVHLVMPWPSVPPDFLASLGPELNRRFRIDHVTVQLEPHDAPADCKHASDDVV